MPGLGQTLTDTWEQGRSITELELALGSAGNQRLSIEFPIRERLQMRDGIERVRDGATRADRRQPVAEREVDAMLLVDVPPRLVGRYLGVDDDAVEVEEECADQTAEATWRGRVAEPAGRVRA